MLLSCHEIQKWFFVHFVIFLPALRRKRRKIHTISTVCAQPTSFIIISVPPLFNLWLDSKIEKLKNSNIESQTKTLKKSSAQKFPKVISNSHVLIFCDIPLKINQLFFFQEEDAYDLYFLYFVCPNYPPQKANCVPKLTPPLFFKGTCLKKIENWRPPVLS